MIKTIKKLLPRGLAWLLPRSGYMNALIAGVAMSFDRLALFLQRVSDEANPATAIDCLEEWYESYGLPYNPTGSLAGRQAKILSRFISLGGQDIVYLQHMIDEAGFDRVTLSQTPSTRAKLTQDTPVGPNNWAVTGFDLTPFIGRTFDIGVWAKNDTLTGGFRFSIGGTVEPRQNYFQSGIFFPTGDLELYTARVTIPTRVGANITDLAGLFLVRPVSPLDGEAFFIDDGFIGLSDINISPSRWVAGSDASISYTYETYPQTLEILLEGSLATPSELARLEALIQRFAPAHLTPVYNMAVDNNVWGESLYGLNRYAGI